MSITDNRVLPLATLRVFLPGQGDPIVDTPWFGWYDLLAETYTSGTVSLNSQQIPTLEWVREIGLVCRATVNLQDTRSSQYTTSGGSWEERRPASGAPRKFRLVQYNSAANQQWSATSKFFLPADPHVAFSLILVDTPADHNATAFPPYVRIEFGNQTWGLEFSKLYGARLVKRVAGTWQTVGDLPQPGSLGNDLDERLILLRVMRGRICVSCDFGKTYTAYADPSGSAISVASSPFTVRGQGGVCAFGLQQIAYSAGTYTSAKRDRYNSGSGTPTITGRQLTPGGTSLLYTDQAIEQFARYRVAFTPGTVTVAGGPFLFHRTPEVYAVTVKYGAGVRLGTGLRSYHTPFDGQIQSIDLDLPLELDGSTATLTIRRDAAENWAGAFRWSRCLLLVADATGSGEVALQEAFAGYIRNPQPGQTEYNKADLRLTLDNLSARMKAKEWEPSTIPLGGMTLNAALSAVLATEGLSPSTSWHSRGDVTLPEGSPEDPAYWPRRGERKWEFMQRMCRDCGLELGVTSTGTWYTVPRDSVAGFVSWVWDAQLAGGSLTRSIQGGSGSLDASEAATGAFVHARDDFGREVSAYAFDTAAETDPSSPRFCEIGRILRQRELSGTSTLGQANLAVQSDFAELTALKEEYELRVPLLLTVGRRDLVQVVNATFGPLGGMLFAVLSQRHHLEKDYGNSSSTFGLRRVR